MAPVAAEKGSAPHSVGCQRAGRGSGGTDVICYQLRVDFSDRCAHVGWRWGTRVDQGDWLGCRLALGVCGVAGFWMFPEEAQ